MQSPAYDRADGIQEMLGSLGGLNNLVNQRREAGYSHHVRLQEFVILGRWLADSCGNFGRTMLENQAPKDRFPHIPDVLSLSDFWAFLKSHGVDVDTSLRTELSGGGLPPDDMICPECRKGWTIHDCHDAVQVHRTEVITLAEFVGQRLAYAQKAVANRNDSVWRMQPDILIRNDRYIDLSPRPGYDTLKVNERGWVGNRDGVTLDHVIESGDEGYFNVWRFYHSSCNRKKLERDQRERFEVVFIKAGFGPVTLEAIPNQYCPCAVCAPWYRVTTPIGVLTIGWRKRVINIDWTGWGQNLLGLFDGEDVTKDVSSIHAGGWDKAVDYLSRIRQSAVPVA